MNRVGIFLLAIMMVLGFAAGNLHAQCCYSAPTVVYSTPAPVVVQRPAPAVVAPAPVTVAPAPVVTYRPVVPTTVYRTAYPVAPPPVVTARPVVIDTDVYVPGQPVRNFFRAITP